jgi:hypothetical protein
VTIGDTICGEKFDWSLFNLVRLTVRLSMIKKYDELGCPQKLDT